MNQLRHALGVHVAVSNGLVSRGFAVSRSTGCNGRDLKTSGEILVATGDNDELIEPKLSSKSYARLIADYSRAIEVQNAASKFNKESNIGRFFSKTPFQSLARVSSLVNIKSVVNSGGSGLCTKSSSSPPLDAYEADDKIDKNSLDKTQVENQAAKRAEWLDHVVNAHNSKRMTENISSSHDRYRGKAHHLVQGLPETNAVSNVKLTGNPSFGSIVKRLQGNSAGDANSLSSQSSPTGNGNAKGFVNWKERYCSSRKKLSGNSGCDGNNVSVTVQRLQETDEAHRELWLQNSGDGNAMLVTVTEESKLPSGSKSSPLRHIDLRINGKPATGVDTVINKKVDKVDVVSSAEKIEITIPVLSKNEKTPDDNSRASNSTINLCISGQETGCKAPNDLGYVIRAGSAGKSMPGISKSGIKSPSTFITPKVQSSRKSTSSCCQTKVIPWWTTIESFRRCETSAGCGSNMATIAGHQEVGDQKLKKVTLSDTSKPSEFAVTKSTSPKKQEIRKKCASVILSIIASETQKKNDERRMSHQVTLEESKSNVKPEGKKFDTKVRSSASNAPQKEYSTGAIISTMPGKSAEASTPTFDEVPKKMADSSGSTVAASGVNSTTIEFKPSIANNFQEKIRPKLISEVPRGNMSIGGRTTFDTRQVSRASDIKAESKIGDKPQQEVVGKTETNAAAPPPLQIPRTYGQIRLLPASQSNTKPANHTNVNNNRCISVKPTNNNRTAKTSDRFYKLKNATIAMIPIVKKKDGTLIDYGLTVNTRKKPQRKLSGSVSVASGLQGKKLTGQKESAVVATVKEVMPRRNRDTCSNATNPLRIEDNARSRLNDNIKRSKSETQVYSSGLKRITSKATTNDRDKLNLKSSVKSKNRHSKDSNESRIVNNASEDKKLMYSAWLHRFKDGTDPTSDPSTRDSRDI